MVCVLWTILCLLHLFFPSHCIIVYVLLFTASDYLFSIFKLLLSLNQIRENRRGNQEWTIQKNWQHWVHKTKTNKTRGNQEWTIQKNWQHWVHKTKTNKTKNTTQKTKNMNNMDPHQKHGGWAQALVKGKQFLPLIRHPPCSSYSQYVLDTTMHNKHK